MDGDILAFHVVVLCFKAVCFGQALSGHEYNIGKMSSLYYDYD